MIHFDFSKSESKKAVIFLHMPKTAGTTFYDAIKFQYKRNEIFTCSGKIEDSISYFYELPDFKKQKIKFFKGHMTFGLHKFLSCPSTYITILRDPIQRFTSLYFYLLQSKSHKQHYLVSEKSLYEFAKQCRAHHNFQTRFIAGERGFDSSYSNREKLEIAQENIENHFSAIGIQERFDESLVLFQMLLGWKSLPLYVRQNKSKRPKDNILDQSTINLIREVNELDIKLYEYAVQRFNKQVTQLGSSFQKSLEAFKLINYLYSPVGNFHSYSRTLALRILKSSSFHF